MTDISKIQTLRGDHIIEFPSFIRDGTIDKFISEDFKWKPPPYLKIDEYQGWDVFKQIYLKLLTGFPDFKYKLLDEIHSKKKSWYLVEASGTHEGVWLGIQATYKKVNYQQLIIVEWDENDKILKVDNLTDSLHLLTTLGGAVIKENHEEKIENYLISLENLGLLPPK